MTDASIESEIKLINIVGLGYVGLDVADLDGWDRFATEQLGMATERAGEGVLRLRMDDRPFRLLLHEKDVADDVSFIGWELPGPGAVDAAAAELASAGLAVEEVSPEECADRRVRRLVRAEDPAGYQLELFCTPALNHTPIVSPVGVSRFVTGELGLGHVVLRVPDIDKSAAFYTDVLGFRLSDRQVRRQGGEALFLHCNQRHHSLALVGPLDPGLHHLMVEVGTLDDVGYAFDRFVDAGLPISKTIGKHTNDHMVSFYGKSPSGIEFEYGCGGIRVDDAVWSTSEITESSFWGHRPMPSRG